MGIKSYIFIFSYTPHLVSVVYCVALSHTLMSCLRRLSHDHMCKWCNVKSVLLSPHQRGNGTRFIAQFVEVREWWNFALVCEIFVVYLSQPCVLNLQHVNLFMCTTTCTVCCVYAYHVWYDCYICAQPTIMHTCASSVLFVHTSCGLPVASTLYYEFETSFVQLCCMYMYMYVYTPSYFALSLPLLPFPSSLIAFLLPSLPLSVHPFHTSLPPRIESKHEVTILGGLNEFIVKFFGPSGSESINSYKIVYTMHTKHKLHCTPFSLYVYYISAK